MLNLFVENNITSFSLNFLEFEMSVISDARSSDSDWDVFVEEDDVLDMSAMNAGAVVDFSNGEIRDLLGNVQVIIEGIQEIENV